MFPPNNQMPPQGGQPPAPGGAPAPAQSQSPLQHEVFTRFQQLTDQEKDALDSVSPEAAAAIMKLLPELKPVLEDLLDEGADDDAEGGEDVTTGPEADEEMDDMEEESGAPFPPRRPQTALGRI